MQRSELKQIRGIGDTMCERLGQDHGIETIADLARLSDAEAEELQQALRATGSHVANGEVARWRDRARMALGEREAMEDEPLATFIVEAHKPAEPARQPRFVVHHMEGGQTLETSEPKPTIEDALGWMQERVVMPSAPVPARPPAEHEADRRSVPGQDATATERPARRGRLRITGLEIHKAGDRAINGTTTSLLADVPVTVEAASAVVFVGHVSLENAEGPVTCQLRCRLQRTDSGQDVTFAWDGEMTGAPGGDSAAISSDPVSIPAGAYRGIVFAEDRGQSARRAFWQLPLLVVG